LAVKLSLNVARSASRFVHGVPDRTNRL